MESEKFFRERGLNHGRLIGFSKSSYRENNKGNDVLFNCNIFTSEDGKIWWGDLNITQDANKLQEITNILNKEMVIVPEMMGRFGFEERPFEEIEEDAHAKFIPNSTEYLSRVYEGLKGVTLVNMTLVVAKGVDWKKISITQ